MEGGNLIAAGTYGCAFTPPLLCKDKRKVQAGLVGKITVKDDADQEILIANKIRTIPLSKNYFLLPLPESCEPAPRSEQSDTNLKLGKCGPIESKDHPLPYEQTQQIFTPFGGKAFYGILKASSFNPKTFDLPSFMQHMLEAGSTLLVAGVCHFDLHPGNILLDTKGVPRLIDFGMSFISKTISTDILNQRWKELAFSGLMPEILNSECPEVTIMNAVFNNAYTNENAIQKAMIGKPMVSDTETYFGISKQQQINSFTEFWSTSGVIQKKDVVGFWRLYWSKFDAWAIGCIFMSILKRLMFYKDTVKNQLVLATIKGLTDVNPRKRLDCIEALSLFDPNNEWIKQFGQKWLDLRRKDRAKI